MKAEHIQSIMLAYVGKHPGCVSEEIQAAVQEQHEGTFCKTGARSWLRIFEADGLLRMERKNGGSLKRYYLADGVTASERYEVGELPPMPALDLITAWWCAA